MLSAAVVHDDDIALAYQAYIDAELSALVWLLARCARAPDDALSAALACEQLEQMAINGQAPPLLKRTAGRLARRWRAEVSMVNDADAADA